MPNVPNHATAVAQCVRRVAAIARYVDPQAKVWLEGVEHTVGEVRAIYQRELDAGARVATLRAELKAAREARKESDAARRETDRALRLWVHCRFGAASVEARGFGFPPRRVGVKSLEVKSRAAALGKATRAARHTMGKRQRLRIRGTLTPLAPLQNDEACASASRPLASTPKTSFVFRAPRRPSVTPWVAPPSQPP